MAIPGLIELPNCPVCLERMDESVDGILTILCNHSFHSRCLAGWSDTRSVALCITLSITLSPVLIGPLAQQPSFVVIRLLGCLLVQWNDELFFIHLSAVPFVVIARRRSQVEKTTVLNVSLRR